MPITITLCGSTKYPELFALWNRKLSLAGTAVFSVGVFSQREGLTLSEQQKKLLDEVHKYKISLSDAIFVLNKDGYIGNSTRNEINYAIENKKEIFFMSEEGLQEFNVPKGKNFISFDKNKLEKILNLLGII